MSKNKRKNSNPGQKQVHPQKTFADYVADATLQKFGGYIDSQIEQFGRALLQRQAQANANLITRILCTEEILMELNPSITKESLAERVSVIIDRNDDFEAIAADDVSKAGDRIRVQLKTRTADQTEYQGSSRLQIDQLGSGNTLGKELEEAMLGLKVNETTEVKFGEDKSLAASITVNRVSRAKVVEAPKKEAAAETKADEQNSAPVEAPKSEETANASVNAG